MLAMGLKSRIDAAGSAPINTRPVGATIRGTGTAHHVQVTCAPILIQGEGIISVYLVSGLGGQGLGIIKTPR
jgi:hypothetical protein